MLVRLALFVGIAVALLVLIGRLGAVGSIELLLVITIAAAISMLATSRRSGRRTTAPRS